MYAHTYYSNVLQTFISCLYARSSTALLLYSIMVGFLQVCLVRWVPKECLDPEDCLVKMASLEVQERRERWVTMEQMEEEDYLENQYVSSFVLINQKGHT